MKTPPRIETARVTGDLKLEIGWSTGETLPIDLADLTQPPFDASAMDGYALRAADAAEPGAILKVIGTSAALL